MASTLKGGVSALSSMHTHARRPRPQPGIARSLLQTGELVVLLGP
jgi:hypothetical protein